MEGVMDQVLELKQKETAKTEIQIKDQEVREFMDALKVNFKKITDQPLIADKDFFSLVKNPAFQDFYKTFKFMWIENVVPLRKEIELLKATIKELEIENEK